MVETLDAIIEYPAVKKIVCCSFGYHLSQNVLE
jgi:hypothetical protein